MLLAAALLLPQLVASAPADAVHLPAPGVEYRTNIASATRKPWVTANGWRMDRDPAKSFFYEVRGQAAATAAAEAFAHGCQAFLHTDVAGAAAFQTMLAFLKALSPAPTQPLADFGVLDDGSAATGEVLNRLALQNFLFRPSDPKLPLTIDLGKTDLPAIRRQVPDKRRLVRLFGSDVVLARLTGDDHSLRLHLINYSGQPVRALRVRLLGAFQQNAASVELQDFDVSAEATEFTVSEVKDYAVIDLRR